MPGFDLEKLYRETVGKSSKASREQRSKRTKRSRPSYFKGQMRRVRKDLGF